MARLTRRGFVKASSALAAAPALTALAAYAQGPAPDTGDLRVEKDIVFGKGGDMDLLLDVYQPPAGVAPKRLAIIHLFGGGFFVGNKNAGYIINDAKALGARGYTNISASYRLQSQGPWPAQIHDVKAAVRWTRANAGRLGIEPNRIVVAGYSAGGMLSLMAAGDKHTHAAQKVEVAKRALSLDLFLRGNLVVGRSASETKFLPSPAERRRGLVCLRSRCIEPTHRAPDV